MNRRRGRRLRTSTRLAVAALIAATAVAPGAAARTLPVGCLNEYPLEMYHIEVNELKPRYRIGRKVDFQIALTMPAHNNPANYLAGMELPWTTPPHSEPAPDVPVSVGITVGPERRQSYLYGTGTTDGQGLVRIRVKLKKYAEPGPAHVVVFAKKSIVSDPQRCFDIVFYGRKLMPNAFEAVD